MTILANHRISSNKKARRLSPAVGKMPFKSNLPYNKKSTTMNKLIEAMFYVRPSTKVAPTLHSPTMRKIPVPSAPPCAMVHRTIYVWDQEYYVEIPSDFDIYGGLRRWYPALYKAVMEEEELVRGDPSTPSLTEDEIEQAWARYEYLEYISDY
jgi:hypothetical protein